VAYEEKLYVLEGFVLEMLAIAVNRRYLCWAKTNCLSTGFHQPINPEYHKRNFGKK
jgi:hypothetical protein